MKIQVMRDHSGLLLMVECVGFRYSRRRAAVQAGDLVQFSAYSRAHSTYQDLHYHWR